MKALKCLLVLLVFSSCGTIVNYDYEKSTDFTQYKTYNFFSDMKTGLSELDNKRLLRAIDAKLKTMDLTRSDNPDFYIDIQSENMHSRNSSNVGVGVGGAGRNIGGGISVGIPLGQNRSSRQIVIDFIDKRNGERLFWQAISESSYSQNASPEKREANFVALVEKIFSKYPPVPKN